MSTEHPGLDRIPVSVLMHDGMRVRGYVYLPSDQRLQDLMNDVRGFIPIDQSNADGTMTMLAKRYMVSIEELDESMTESVLGPLRLV
ncbi:hypothetical protein [Rhodoferax sp. GW822-FHT02A01]|uniref:DUF6812 domain-containing protein n=1 Tax=Rhodoferax sp. GW822-FHT02A01 TaxID=3141537 RepID=UPI00315DDC34